MRNIFGILLLAVLVSSTATGCSEDTRPHANPSGGVGTSLDTDWKVRTPDPSHVLVFLQDQGTIAHKLFFVELGKAGMPAGMDLPTAFVSATLVPGGKQLDCADDKGKIWSFVIDGSTSVREKIVLAAKGLSEMNDTYGWNLSKTIEYSGSGWDLAGLLQVNNPGPDPAPAVGGCASGGLGSTSCSQTVNGMGCTASCGGGYYSCCYFNTSGSPRCRCVDDQKTK